MGTRSYQMRTSVLGRDADGDIDFWVFGILDFGFWLLDSGQGTSSFGMLLKASVGWIRMRCMI